MKTWARRHREALYESIARLRRTPLATLLTIAVIGITLALPGGLYLAVDNTRQLARGWEANGQVSLFLKQQVNDAEAQKLAEKIRRLPGVKSVSFISRAQALAEFKRYSGFGEVLNLLERNPLPAVLVVQPAQLRPEALAKLTTELGQQAGVDIASLDLDWVRRLHAILEFARRAVAILAGLLGIAVLIIVGNTVRLAVLSRREEIEVTKLVGGTDAFIRRPFLYSGLLQGSARRRRGIPVRCRRAAASVRTGAGTGGALRRPFRDVGHGLARPRAAGQRGGAGLDWLAAGCRAPFAGHRAKITNPLQIVR